MRGIHAAHDSARADFSIGRGRGGETGISEEQINLNP
jgi:hypothetical protein